MEADAQQEHGEATTEDPLLEAARRLIGVDYLFPYQRLVISNVLDRRNQIVVLPTGAGKSLCFLLPAALLDGLTIIVYPLRSLIADQARRLGAGAIPAEPLTGETPKSDRDGIYRRCREGVTKILLTNPEMLVQQNVRAALGACNISHLVIDEAHVLPEWGESFRPAYLEFARGASELGASMISAFTATASESIERKLVGLLFDGNAPHRISGVPDRPNIHYSVVPTLSVRHSLNRLAAVALRPMIIFCSSRAGAELTARVLRSDVGDNRIRFYHAGLEPSEKAEVEAWFFDSTDGILASTCAYGMGVDKPDIRTVVHTDVPQSVEAYLQETGRAGRDRKPSRAVALASAMTLSTATTGNRDDESLQLDRRDSSRISDRRRRSMLTYLASVDRCRRKSLLAHLGAPDVDCTGCDVCDGTTIRSEEVLRSGLTFFLANSRRYGPAEAAAALASTMSRRTREMWRLEETTEIVDGLAGAGLIGLPRNRITRMLTGPRFLLRRSGWKRIIGA